MASRQNDIDDPRREFLLQALTAGAFIVAPGALQAGWFDRPKQLSKGQSIYSMKGQVWVNGQSASRQTYIGPTDTIATGKRSEVVFAVGKDAFILRENSKMELSSADNVFIQSMRVLSGKLLSVFGKRDKVQPLNMYTPTATMGIRGTGVYLEASAAQTYICTCYGIVDIASSIDANQTVRVHASHHDAPKYIGKQGQMIKPAPFKNHTDQELKLIEALVGRETPFGLEDAIYRGPRRDY